MILLIDNYDSFTYNLLHYFGEVGADNIEVKRNDAITAEQAIALNPQAIIISPGPCDPNKAGICLDLIKQSAGKIPIFGVCLGHQSIGQAFGGHIIRADAPMHGKTSIVKSNGRGIFKDLPQKFEVTRYHSLIIEKNTLPECLEITCETDDGVIMGLQHKELPIYGVQFHPESIASQYGREIIKNFLTICKS